MKNKKVIIIVASVVAVLIIVGIVAACILLGNKDKENEDNIVNDEQNVMDNEMPLDEANDENVVDENAVTNNEENQENKQEENKTEENKQEENKQETNTENKEEKKETTTNNNSSTTQSSQSSSAQTTSSKPNSTSNSSSNTETKTETKTESKPTVTGTDSKRELTNTETKYGVVIKTYTTTTYDVYSDGSKKEKSKKTDTEYDQSGYKASTSELQAEAKQLKSSNSSLINGVLKYVNEYRKEANTKAVDGVTNRKDLVLDSNLTVAACARAMEMAYGNKFDHKRPNGSSCFTILKEMGISYMACGENIAYGSSTAEGVSKQWKNSSGHYANMIDSSYGKIGIGVIKFRGTYYWVQMFTN